MTSPRWMLFPALCFACARAEPSQVPAGTLPDLDRRSYAHRMLVQAHHFPGENRSASR